MKSIPTLPADLPFAATSVVPEEPRLEDPDEIEEYRHSLWQALGLAVEDERESAQPHRTGRWSQSWSSAAQTVLHLLPFHHVRP